MFFLHCAHCTASGKSVKLYHFGLAAAASSTASQEEEDEEQELAVKVRDDALVQDSLGSRTWGAAPLLASHLLDVHLPSYIVEKGRELQQHHRKEMTGRILELGSGTGLVGLAAFLYLRHRLSSTSGPASSPLPILHHVHLTDSNPDVMRNLQHNMTLNDHNKNEQVGKSIASSQSTNAQGQGQVRLHLSTLDWSNIESSPLINEDKFDLIIAAGELLVSGMGIANWWY